MSLPAREGPPKLEKSCPLPRTHTRLHQVHDLWHRVAADYADPDAFVVSVNASLQALRSVSFMLKKENAQVPDFATWYRPHEQSYKSDPLMRWLKDARNHVEKEGDLDLHSHARVSLLGVGDELQDLEFEVPPLLDEEEIASFMGPRLSDRVKSVAVLSVERRWVAADLPEHELLDLLAHGYGKVAEVVADAHRQCGILMQTFGDEVHERRPRRRKHLGGRLSCMVAHSELRTAHLHLSRNVLVKVEGRSRELTREDVEEPPFAVPDDLFTRSEGEDLLHTAARFADFARLVTAAQGLPPADGNGVRDARRRARHPRATSGRLPRAADDDGRGRARSRATECGGRHLKSGEGGGVELGETRVEDGLVPEFFTPVLRTWTRMGRVPARPVRDVP